MSEISIQQDLAYYVTKFNTDGVLPSWTGFEQLLSQVEVLSKSVVGYFIPVIGGSSTDMNTVLTILEKSVEIAGKLKLQKVVVVMDQAIYAKAQVIRWQNAKFMQSCDSTWSLSYNDVLSWVYWEKVSE